MTGDGGGTITKRGVLYALTSANANPTLGGAFVTEVDDATATTGTFSEIVIGLSHGTGYSFVAFATNSAGTTYTAPVSTFTTLVAAPTLTLPTVTNVTSTTATLGGNVTGNGGGTITRRGVLYSLTSANANPTLGGSGVTEVDDASATTGTFSENVTGLSPGTSYSFVAFATNSAGTTYTTPVSSFGTFPAPTVTFPTVTNVTSTTATLGGNVASDGGGTITKRGVLYAITSVDSNPTLGGSGVTEVDDASATTGAFSENVTGLSPGTGYSFVAFATNSAGTTYTIPISTFKTAAPPVAPVFQGEHRMTAKVKKNKVTEFVLKFSAALRSPNALYRVTQPGKTKKSAPKHVAVTSMTLGPAGTSVILTLGSYAASKPLTLMVSSGPIGTDGAAVAPFLTRL